MLVTTFEEYKHHFLPDIIIDAIEEAMLLIKDSIPEDGMYPLKNNVNAFVMRYNTKDIKDISYESHKIMADIQILLDGEEFIYVADSANLTVSNENYEANKRNDLYFYKEKPKEIARAHLSKGTFAIIFPPIAHAPAIMIDKPSHVTKMVIKIPLN